MGVRRVASVAQLIATWGCGLGMPRPPVHAAWPARPSQYGSFSSHRVTERVFKWHLVSVVLQQLVNRKTQQHRSMSSLHRSVTDINTLKWIYCVTAPDWSHCGTVSVSVRTGINQINHKSVLVYELTHYSSLDVQYCIVTYRIIGCGHRHCVSSSFWSRVWRYHLAHRTQLHLKSVNTWLL